MVASRLAHKYQDQFSSQIKERRDPNTLQNWNMVGGEGAQDWAQRRGPVETQSQGTWRSC